MSVPMYCACVACISCVDVEAKHGCGAFLSRQRETVSAASRSAFTASPFPPDPAAGGRRKAPHHQHAGASHRAGLRLLRAALNTGASHCLLPHQSAGKTNSAAFWWPCDSCQQHGILLDPLSLCLVRSPFLQAPRVGLSGLQRAEMDHAAKAEWTADEIAYLEEFFRANFRPWAIVMVRAAKRRALWSTFYPLRGLHVILIPPPLPRPSSTTSTRRASMRSTTLMATRQLPSKELCRCRRRHAPRQNRTMTSSLFHAPGLSSTPL